ncbi:MAG: hypothetical protein ACLRM9_02505 [Collinsella aerofaciens]
MRHFLRGLAVLIEEGHVDEALGRINELCETNDRTAVRRYCANETVNIVLSSFSSDINRNGITADLRAAVPENVHVADVDLFSVLECPGQRHRRRERRSPGQTIRRSGPALRRRAAAAFGL